MSAKFDARGREIPDRTPIEMPANATRPESMNDMIARLVRQQVSQVALEQGYGSFEEEDDFSDPDEGLPEPISEFYVNEAEFQPLDGSESDLDGSEGVPEPPPQPPEPKTRNEPSEGSHSQSND